MISENFIYLGIFLNSIASVGYIVETIKGKVKPNRVTFFLWALAPLIIFFSEIKQGVGLQALLAFVVGFWPLLTLLASFINKKAEWKITKFDIICGFLSMSGLILWSITKVGNIAIIFSIMADALAALPTLKKSYFYPETENAWIYITGSVYAGITLITVKTWNFPHYGFPVYLFLANAIIAFVIKFNLKKVSKKG